MADETSTQLGHVVMQITKGFLEMQLVKEIFIRIPRGAMSRKPTAAKCRGVGQVAQILFPRWRELLAGPMHGFLRVLTEIVVEAEITGRLIVIPRNDDVAHILH